MCINHLAYQLTYTKTIITYITIFSVNFQRKHWIRSVWLTWYIVCMMKPQNPALCWKSSSTYWLSNLLEAIKFVDIVSSTSLLRKSAFAPLWMRGLLKHRQHPWADTMVPNWNQSSKEVINANYTRC